MEWDKGQRQVRRGLPPLDKHQPSRARSYFALLLISVSVRQGMVPLITPSAPHTKCQSESRVLLLRLVHCMWVEAERDACKVF